MVSRLTHLLACQWAATLLRQEQESACIKNQVFRTRTEQKLEQEPKGSPSQTADQGSRGKTETRSFSERASLAEPDQLEGSAVEKGEATFRASNKEGYRCL